MENTQSPDPSLTPEVPAEQPPIETKPAEVATPIPTEFRVTPDMLTREIKATCFTPIVTDVGTVIGQSCYLVLHNGYVTPSFPVLDTANVMYGGMDTRTTPEMNGVLFEEAKKLAMDHLWFLLGYEVMSRLNNYTETAPWLGPKRKIDKDFLDRNYVKETNAGTLSHGLLSDVNYGTGDGVELESRMIYPNSQLGVIHLKNGYTIFGIASVIDIRNNVPEIGRSVALDNAYKQLHQLATYLQLEMKHRAGMARSLPEA